MIGYWQDERDLKRRRSDRSVNRHDTCRVAAYLNQPVERDASPPALGSRQKMIRKENSDGEHSEEST